MATPNQTSVVQKNTNNYPDHKTVSLVEETTIANTEPPIRESRTQQPLSPPANNQLSSTAYPNHKTVDIAATDTTDNTTNTTTDQLTANSYPAHKTVIVSAETATEVRTVAPPVVQPQATGTAPSTLASGTYPVHKTVNLQQENTSSVPVTAAQEERKASPVLEQETTTQNQVINKVESSEPSAEQSQTTNYPTHKTYSFYQEESGNESQEARTKGEETRVKSQEPRTNEESLKSNIATSNNQQPTTVSLSGVESKQPSPKAKKPVLWIALSSVFFLLTLAAAWYGYSKQSEISTLKASNEALEENIQLLQKELFIDDIIARGGKIDAKNNITVTDVAANSEMLRVCFSVSGNPRAKAGKKTIYIRIIDAANKSLTASKGNTFEYKQEQLSYTAKEVINYKNNDMMLCVDYKPTEKLQKGTYKAEIYSEGVLDGSTTFELK